MIKEVKIFIFIVVFLAIIPPLITEPYCQKSNIVLEKEFIQINHPSSTSCDYQNLSRRYIRYYISSSYQASLTEEEIQKYYQGEFARNGWELFSKTDKDRHFVFEKNGFKTELILKGKGKWILSMGSIGDIWKPGELMRKSNSIFF